ncbi:hypothetical protein DSM104443_00549 [Usitatibacter rugosus]|uniref:Uncharacterized protein n=1 Tax=Usitatibacter rugosus TaxID=2732067 RepID=A0A6M4GR18_9PROT|nr:hypothetical protein [Usitatibacter rugosus]QJR09505.1 hypothetical protein DSM104443_00549 [Usitatibacter rugosus]
MTLVKLATLAIATLFAPLCGAGELVIDVSSPDVTITVPNVPAMKMERHPMSATQPHARLLGSEGSYTVSVLMPTADAGMSALECASSTIGALSKRPGVPPQAQIYKARINAQTFIAIYAAPASGAVLLHAHLVSAAAGTHCVEVHVSKVSMSQDDLKPWFKDWDKANISAK